MLKKLINYTTADGKQPFLQWLRSLRDKTHVARIRARLDRVENGNFGDMKSVGHGVFELRLRFGSGYRIYFGQDGADIVVLMIGGDKSSQKRDIQKAHYYWADYLERVHDEKED